MEPASRVGATVPKADEPSSLPGPEAGLSEMLKAPPLYCHSKPEGQAVLNCEVQNTRQA